MITPAFKDRLTTRAFWVDYWSKAKLELVTDQVFFKSLVPFFPKAPATILEIGGFPGLFTTYFKKFHNYDVTLLDYVIVQDIIHEVEKNNGLAAHDIQIIEGDLFELAPTQKFDVVFSAGFIEHFKNVDAVFEKHVAYMKPGGTLFISLPNFKGLSGFVQKCFDKPNYDVHNIDIMEKLVFEKLCAKHNLKVKFLDYYGKPHMWLDNPKKAGFFARTFVKVGNALLMRLHKILNGSAMNGRTLSPYIVLIATL